MFFNVIYMIYNLFVLQFWIKVIELKVNNCTVYTHFASD